MKIPRLILASLAIFCFTVAAYAGKKTEPTSSVNLTIVRDANGKPVKNAEVVLHMVQKGKEKQEGLELKTHEDGKAEASGLPYGTWRIQVIAPGYRTYGQDFELNQPTHEFTIKLQKPAGQVSIYK
ncbi:MAG TPA: prealbumin-like fold domain-containing protein [Candidatus Angelobacter sp.]|nr:prealbumin-like fold domain-containing protein [Candidatus Angelobacter sp.]